MDQVCLKLIEICIGKVHKNVKTNEKEELKGDMLKKTDMMMSDSR